MMGFGDRTTLRTYKEVHVDPGSLAVTAFTSGTPSYESIVG